MLKSGCFFDLARATNFLRQWLFGDTHVRCRYNTVLENHQETLEYEMFYLNNMVEVFDPSILIDTVKFVLLRIGSS